MQHATSTLYRYAGPLTAVVLVACSLVACSGDPAARKQALLESGNAYFEKGEFPTAIIQYRNAVDIDPTFGEARKRLGLAYVKVGDASRALEELVRAADLLPSDVDIQLTAGTLLLAARRPEDAKTRADVILKNHPDDVRAHLLRGNALAGSSSFDEALESIEEAIRLDPARGTSFTNLGLVELARGKRNEAEAAFKKAVELAPDSVETFLALGNFYWSAGNAKETEEAFRGALKAKPDHGPANRVMAALMIATGRYRDAEPFLVRAAESSKTLDAEFALSDYYLASGRATDAIARLETRHKDPATQKVPAAAVMVGERLARAYAASGDTARAKSVVEQILAGNPKAVNAQVLKGQLLMTEGHRDEALAAVQSAVAANPASAEAQFALGRLYAARRDTVAAEAAFREVLRINPRATVARLEIARLELAGGRTDASLRTAQEAAKSAPTDLGARLTLVNSMLASKDLAGAEREINALKTAFPKVASVHVQAGLLATLKNDVTGARSAFNQAQTLDPKSIEALSGIIALDLRTNNPAAARARVEERLKQGSSPALLLLAARTFWAAKDQAAAERALRQAIEADPSILTPYEMLGQLYVSQKKLDQARAEFETLASKQTKPVGALTMSAIILQSQGNVALARKRYQDVLAIDPRAAIAANNLAWILAEAGEDLDVALQLAQTATSVSPDSLETLDTLGWVYYKKNQPLQAIPIFRQCVEKAPNNAGYHYHLGLAYLQAGETDRGRASLQKALASGADATTAADIRRLLGAQNPAATR